MKLHNEVPLDQIYRKAMLIHRTDERFRSLLMSGRIMMAYYPVRGQEVLAAAAMSALNKDDYLVTTYRGLHDSLAKGVPSRLLWAEYLGRATGTCKGKGGPMHLTHPETGVMVTTGVVGSGLPIANGLAMSSQEHGNGRVTIVCFGDGASNIGAFHESLNMASLWKLPVIFLCQNNQFAEHTAYSAGTSAARIVDRAAGYGLRGVHVNGNDPVAMFKAARDAAEHARRGDGPTLIEAETFRMLPHIFGSDDSYVPADQARAAVERDPVPQLRLTLLEQGMDETELIAIEKEITDEIDDAVAFAMDSAFPDAAEIRRDVFKEEIAA